MSTSPKLLVIDDDHEICDILSELLSEDFIVLTVSTPESALEAIKDEHFDLLLTDTVLNTSKTVVELIQEIRTISNKLPICLMSGHDEQHHLVSDALQQGANGFIGKPFLNIEEIIIYLKSLINN